MELKLDKRFKKDLQARFEGFDIKVGILKDGPHRTAKPASSGLGTYAGGRVRKKGRKGSESISDVAESIRTEQRVEWLSGPFESQSSDILKFSSAFLKMALSENSESMLKRVRNLAQAIVRNPILRGDYGGNSEQAKRWKTFDRYLIDTAQFFRAITAEVKKVGRKRAP